MEEKQCTKCKRYLSALDFYKGDAECKACRKSRVKKQYTENPEKWKVREQAARKANPEKFREYEVKRAYGLTPEAYYGLLESQDNACAGCRRKFSTTIRPYIDHDHACCPQSRGICGKCVRGALCRSCNLVLGNLSDNIETLQRLKDYLIKHKEKDAQG